MTKDRVKPTAYKRDSKTTREKIRKMRTQGNMWYTIGTWPQKDTQAALPTQRMIPRMKR